MFLIFREVITKVSKYSQRLELVIQVQRKYYCRIAFHFQKKMNEYFSIKWNVD